MNIKRFMLSVITLFVFLFLFDWMLHGWLLKTTYEQTASLWRTPQDMQQHFIWLLLGQYLIALMFCFIYTKGYEGRGVGEGVRYGLYVAILFTGPHLIAYAAQPIPLYLIGYWILGALSEFILGGIILSLIYKD